MTGKLGSGLRVGLGAAVSPGRMTPAGCPTRVKPRGADGVEAGWQRGPDSFCRVGGGEGNKLCSLLALTLLTPPSFFFRNMWSASSARPSHSFTSARPEGVLMSARGLTPKFSIASSA
ncbi:MAG: hypothetical protein QW407_03820 [Thermofilaceae archaeon]